MLLDDSQELEGCGSSSQARAGAKACGCGPGARARRESDGKLWAGEGSAREVVTELGEWRGEVFPHVQPLNSTRGRGGAAALTGYRGGVHRYRPGSEGDPSGDGPGSHGTPRVAPESSRPGRQPFRGPPGQARPARCAAMAGMLGPPAVQHTLSRSAAEWPGPGRRRIGGPRNVPSEMPPPSPRHRTLALRASERGRPDPGGDRPVDRPVADPGYGSELGPPLEESLRNYCTGRYLATFADRMAFARERTGIDSSPYMTGASYHGDPIQGSSAWRDFLLRFWLTGGAEREAEPGPSAGWTLYRGILISSGRTPLTPGDAPFAFDRGGEIDLMRFIDAARAMAGWIETYMYAGQRIGSSLNAVLAGRADLAVLRWTPEDWEGPLRASLGDSYNDTAEYAAHYNLERARLAPNGAESWYNPAAMDLLDRAGLPADVVHAIFLPRAGGGTAELDMDVPSPMPRFGPAEECSSPFEALGSSMEWYGFLHRRWNAKSARYIMQANYEGQLAKLPQIVHPFRSTRGDNAPEPINSWADPVAPWISAFATFIHECCHAAFDELPVRIASGGELRCNYDPRELAELEDWAIWTGAHDVVSIISNECAEAFVLGWPTGGRQEVECNAVE